MKKDLPAKIILLFTFCGIAIALVILFGSCNPVKQVLKDEAKIKKVFDEGVRKGWCVNDTLTKSDTTFLLDTLYMLETKSDTVRKNDTVYITNVKDRVIEKKMFVHDTAYITDKALINLLNDDILKLKNEKADLKNVIADQKNIIQDLKKDKRKAWFYFWGLVGLLVLIILVKVFWKSILTYLRIISPIKI